MTENEQSPKKPFPWAIAMLCTVAVLLGVFALTAYLKPVLVLKELAGKGVDAGLYLVTNAPTIAERFKTGTITHTFREGIPTVSSTHGDVLELAVSQSDETFTLSDTKRVAWDWVYLGTTIAEIRVPVTFRYHLRLSDTWRLAARDQVCIVLSPSIRPSVPPAIHTDKMEKRAESGWARFDKGEQLIELEKSMTATLAERAGDGAHKALVREACRQSVAAFVRNWLMREDHWRADRFTSIVVVFPDEIPAAGDEDLARHPYEPTIRFESK